MTTHAHPSETTAAPTQMQTLAAIGTSVGHVRDIEIHDADHECPTHGVPLQEQRLDSVSGWQSLLVCPAYDGACRYDPNGSPVQIDPPETNPTDDPDSTADPVSSEGA